MKSGTWNDSTESANRRSETGCPVKYWSGLSSSAALEMSAALAIAAAFDVEVPPVEMAKIGQKAEHDYAGCNCGLLDQASSLFGKRGCLVRSDFRSLTFDTVARTVTVKTYAVGSEEAVGEDPVYHCPADFLLEQAF